MRVSLARSRQLRDEIMTMKKILTEVGAFLALYFLLVVFAPYLGFTLLLDLVYVCNGNPVLAGLWIFLFGPACLFVIALLMPKD